MQMIHYERLAKTAGRNPRLGLRIQESEARDFADANPVLHSPARPRPTRIGTAAIRASDSSIHQFFASVGR
jgi:hypothetical protein